jgi:hypothetical protein
MDFKLPEALTAQIKTEIFNQSKNIIYAEGLPTLEDYINFIAAGASSINHAHNIPPELSKGTSIYRHIKGQVL